MKFREYIEQIKESKKKDLGEIIRKGDIDEVYEYLKNTRSKDIIIYGETLKEVLRLIKDEASLSEDILEDDVYALALEDDDGNIYDYDVSRESKIVYFALSMSKEPKFLVAFDIDYDSYHDLESDSAMLELDALEEYLEPLDAKVSTYGNDEKKGIVNYIKKNYDPLIEIKLP